MIHTIAKILLSVTIHLLAATRHRPGFGSRQAVCVAGYIRGTSGPRCLPRLSACLELPHRSAVTRVKLKESNYPLTLKAKWGRRRFATMAALSGRSANRLALPAEMFSWCPIEVSNSGPSGYKAAALPTELIGRNLVVPVGIKPTCNQLAFLPCIRRRAYGT